MPSEGDIVVIPTTSECPVCKKTIEEGDLAVWSRGRFVHPNTCCNIRIKYSYWRDTGLITVGRAR